MKVDETKNGLVVKWNPKAEKDLTWRKVREWCKSKIFEMQQSKEYERIKHYKFIIDDLQNKVDNFEKRLIKYRSLMNGIKDSDPDIDTPFGEKEQTNDSNNL